MAIHSGRTVRVRSPCQTRKGVFVREVAAANDIHALKRPLKKQNAADVEFKTKTSQSLHTFNRLNDMLKPRLGDPTCEF